MVKHASASLLTVLHALEALSAVTHAEIKATPAGSPINGIQYDIARLLYPHAQLLSIILTPSEPKHCVLSVQLEGRLLTLIGAVAQVPIVPYQFPILVQYPDEHNSDNPFTQSVTVTPLATDAYCVQVPLELV